MELNGQTGEGVFGGLPPVPPMRQRTAMPERRKSWLIAGVVIVVVALAAGVVLALQARRAGSVTGGTVTMTPGGLVFENAAEHLRFTAPAGWTRFPTRSAQVMVRGDGCSFGLLEQRTRLAAAALANAEAKDFERRHPETRPVVVTRRVVAGEDALTFGGHYQDSEGGAMTQTYLLVDRGKNVVTLVETATAAGCAGSFSALERGLSL